MTSEQQEIVNTEISAIKAVNVILFMFLITLIGSIGLVRLYSLPKFHKEECIRDTAQLEWWDKEEHQAKRVISVGLRNYRVEYLENGDFESLKRENVSFSDDYAYETVQCPLGLDR